MGGLSTDTWVQERQKETRFELYYGHYGKVSLPTPKYGKVRNKSVFVYTLGGLSTDTWVQERQKETRFRLHDYFYKQFLYKQQYWEFIL